MSWIPDAAAGWRPDPLGRHRLRYWDGRAWTHLVADGTAVTEDPADCRRFVSELTVLLAPVFVVFFSGLALAALAGGAFFPAAVSGGFGLLLLVTFLRQPYLAVLGLDGTLTFRAPVRSVTFRVDDLVAIGRSRTNFIVSDGARTAVLGTFGGEALAMQLLRVRPELPAPERVRRRTEI